MAPLGVAHVSCGFASLVLGAGVFSLGKGTDLHRAVGALYVLSMFGLNLTAMLIYNLFGGVGVFHVISLINLAILLAGFFTVLLQRPRKRWLHNHYYLMGWSYVGLWAALAARDGRHDSYRPCHPPGRRVRAAARAAHHEESAACPPVGLNTGTPSPPS